MQNLEQFSTLIIGKLADHKKYKEAKQLILSKDRWEDGIITDAVFRKTIQAYRDIVTQTDEWSETERGFADVLDQAIIGKDNETRDELLRFGWKYRDGLIEEDELRQKAVIEYKKLAKNRSEPLYKSQLY